MPRALVNGININYEQVGSGPPLVLIHGLTGSLEIWQRVIAPALSDTFTVVTLDLRGHGQSDMPTSGYSTADLANDAIGLLDSLNIDRAHIVGHSIGGVIALHSAVLRPDRVCAVSMSDSRIRALQPAQKVKDWPHWETWKGQLEQQGLTVDGESELDFTLIATLFVRKFTAEGMPKGEEGRIDKWEKLLTQTTAATDLKDSAGLTAERIAQLGPPLQAIYGEYSFCRPTLDGLRNLLPSLTTVVLPGVGHLFPIMRPALFIERVKAFHGGLEAPSPEITQAEPAPGAVLQAETNTPDPTAQPEHAPIP
jgi:pimeloyl-ACP methyl ester carboxylesterase